MKRRLRWLIILAGLGGAVAACATTRNSVGLAGTPSTDADLLAAEAIAWQALGRTDTPPTVRIVATDQLTCVDPASGNPGFPVLLADGCGCRNGYTISPWAVSLSQRLPWSESSLPHELEHAAQARRGIVDPDHARPEWKTDVPRARELMRAHGM